MSEEEIYQNFVDWLGKTWWGLTPSELLMPLMKARYTVEEAAFLTGMPHSATSLEDLARIKGEDAAALEPQLKQMCFGFLVSVFTFSSIPLLTRTHRCPWWSPLHFSWAMCVPPGRIMTVKLTCCQTTHS